MALINCPECGKQISDKAGACPNCGCPIANAPTDVKIRALSDGNGVLRSRYYIGGRMVAEVPVGSVATINIDKPTVIEVRQKAMMQEYSRGWKFTAVPGKCYESRYCKPGVFYWETITTEVTYITQ